MFQVSHESSKTYKEVLWEGRPWIVPSAVARTIVVIVIAVLIIWFEFYDHVALDLVAKIPVFAWTAIVFSIVWLLSMFDLVVLRASHRYKLLNDSLEIRDGIVSLRQFVIVPSGFSNLETRQSILERALDYGSIVVYSQSETDPERKMMKVRNPVKVAEQVRYVMARPIVRMEKPEVQTDQEANEKH